jgi:copper chaperone CopZ
MSVPDARYLEEQLTGVSGVTEAKVIVEEGVAYLKVDSRRLDESALRVLLPSI